jgi:hypothetical protein
MTTEAQIIANRLNARKSTGPRTLQGKAIASQNAVTHGLTADHDVISSESRAEFEQYRNQMLAELDPDGHIESMLAERIVGLAWRLKRINCIQNQTIDALHAKITNDPLAKLHKKMLLQCLHQPQEDSPENEAALALGNLAIKDFSDARVLEHLLMYERRIEASLYKTLLELQRHQLIRKMNPLNTNDTGY